MEITDVNGRLVVGVSDYSLQPGTNQFRVTLSSAGAYVMTARCNGKTSSIKMVNNGSGNVDKIDYVGVGNIPASKSETRGNTNNPFNFGDLMEYVGYATINGTEYESDRITQMQGASQTFELIFGVVQHTIPTVTTTAVSDITTTSAIVGGNVVFDGGENVFDRGICYNTGGMPTISDNCIHIGQGTGIFSDVLNGLQPDSSYYVRAFAINSIGVAYGIEVSFSTILTDGQPCPGNATITDIDGNIYNTVQIGQQCWMKENLRTTRWNENSLISISTTGSTSSNTTAYRYAPDNDTANVPIYGYLYNWPAVMHGASASNSNPSGVQGICPTGWHVPSTAEWMQLTDYVSSINEYSCSGNNEDIAKSLASNDGWDICTTVCAVGNLSFENNSTGFSALPSGNIFAGSGTSINHFATFWSTTEDGSYSTYCGLSYQLSYVSYANVVKRAGFSVRCLKD